jgi:glycosyltransferase involved in cell wall biosynthesis
MSKVSVIICTHNPRRDYLQRTLEALRRQTLSKDLWELLVVDNNSQPELRVLGPKDQGTKRLRDSGAAASERPENQKTKSPKDAQSEQAEDLRPTNLKLKTAELELGWHSNARVVREEELGLTPARLRGIREATGDLLVFVDDDNVLDVDYLEQACRIAEEFPHVGAWGGSCRGEFEVPLPDWAKPYLTGLVVKEIEKDYWSNLKDWSLATPYGAGMCMRKSVADEFARRIEDNRNLRKLGRTGRVLMAGEDSVMAECAIDCGMGTGRFARMGLTHLIPEERLTEDYIVRLYAGFHISSQIAAKDAPRPSVAWLQRLRSVYGSLWRWWHATPIERKIMQAVRTAGYEVQ